MATITELESTVPGKLSILDYVWAVFVFIFNWIFRKPLAKIQEMLKTKQVPGSEKVNEPHGKLVLVGQAQNWIINGSRQDFNNESNKKVTNTSDALKIWLQKFRQTYVGSFYKSNEKTSTFSFSHVTVMNLLQSPNCARFKRNLILEGIIEKLTRFQDNADFEAFDEYSSVILDRYSNESMDIKVAVLIEQSRCMLYRSRFARAKLLARTALKLAESSVCRQKYIARACLVLSACYRGKGKLGKARSFLDEAWQNIANTSYYEERCSFYDAYGSYLNGISDTLTQSGDRVLTSAKECFFKQLQVATSCERKKKQQFYALLKLARTLLDANTIVGQQRDVPSSDVTKAEKYLDKIEAELWEDVGRGTHMQFVLIRIKQYYRQRRFEEAVSLLNECIVLATSLGYERDKQLMVEGLKTLTAKLEVQKIRISSTQIIEDGSCSSSEGPSQLESFDSGSDSVHVFGSEDSA